VAESSILLPSVFLSLRLRFYEQHLSELIRADKQRQSVLSITTKETFSQEIVRNEIEIYFDAISLRAFALIENDLFALAFAYLGSGECFSFPFESLAYFTATVQVASVSSRASEA
jgi:hypothetical protein